VTLGIVRTNWSGTTGGPGLTQMAIDDGTGGAWSSSAADLATAAVRSFWDGIRAFVPNEVTLLVQPSVDQYDASTGWLIHTTVAPTSPAPVSGSSSAAWAGAAGFKVDWNTGAIRNGRRIVGKTYVVPAAAIYDTSGLLSTTPRNNVEAAANTLLSTLASAGMSMRVWTRPPTIGAPGGVSTAVQSAVVRNKTAIMRSRRD
jgi:hypothetical protein